MASKVAEKKTPIERDGWDKWYENNLPDLKDCLSSEELFKEFGYKLQVLVLRLKWDYTEIKAKTKPELHRKRTAITLKNLSETLRERNFFKRERSRYRRFLHEILQRNPRRRFTMHRRQNHQNEPTLNKSRS